MIIKKDGGEAGFSRGPMCGLVNAPKARKMWYFCQAHVLTKMIGIPYRQGYGASLAWDTRTLAGYSVSFIRHGR